MRIKRFTARDMKTVLQLVKDELGAEAVILTTRETRDPIDGEPSVEVTAAVDYHPAAPARRPPEQTSGRNAPEQPEKTLPSPKVENELAEIKELLLNLTHRSSISERLRDRKDLVRLYRGLIDSELDPGLARILVEKVATGANGDSHGLKVELGRWLASLLKVSSPLEKKTAGRPCCLALVGPSGVGKTTTLAKLAALASVKLQKKAAIISLDTYRLGAAEQMKTYARIMGLPLRVAQDKEEFKQAVDLFEDMDYIFIDTAGRSLANVEARRELTEILAEKPGISVLLVLSATTKDRDLAGAIRQAEVLPVSGLVISKIDETERYGNVINNLLKFKKPVSFLTNGQKVPDDLITATPGRLAELVTSVSTED